MKKIISLLILLMSIKYSWALDNGRMSGLVLSARLDTQCFQITFQGPCPTPKYPFVGVRVSYWEPTYFIETVKMPGDYVITETGILLHDLAKNTAKTEASIFFKQKDIQVDSQSSYQAINGSNLQFNDVHVIEFPIKEMTQAALCPNPLDNSFALHYLSEVDCVAWRKSKLDIGIQQTIGNWGRLYPRGGFLIHSSPLVASALTSIRAMHIVSNPLSTHIVLGSSPALLNFNIDRMQLVYPKKSSCMAIGSPLSFYEHNNNAYEKYVWIYWRHRECCRTVSG